MPTILAVLMQQRQILALFIGGVLLCAALFGYYGKKFERTIEKKRVMWDAKHVEMNGRYIPGHLPAHVNNSDRDQGQITTPGVRDQLTVQSPVKSGLGYDSANKASATSKQKNVTDIRSAPDKDSPPASGNRSHHDFHSHRVPNIVHFVSLSKTPREFMFTDLASVMRVDKIQNPDHILIHCNHEPSGYWWDELLRSLRDPDKVELVLIDLGDVHPEPNRTDIHLVTDLVKVTALLQRGGIYLDFDVIVINNLDPLRGHSVTLGQEKTPSQLNLNVILAEKNATFLTYLQRFLYKQLQSNASAIKQQYNSGSAPYKLWRQHPELLHVEQETLTVPGPSEKRFLYSSGSFLSHWRQLYAVHLMFEKRENSVYDPKYIKKLKTVIGQVLRLAYYGSADEFDPYLPHNLYHIKELGQQGP